LTSLQKIGVYKGKIGSNAEKFKIGEPVVRMVKRVRDQEKIVEGRGGISTFRNEPHENNNA